MGKRGNFKIRSRRVNDVAIIVTDHETVHIFKKGLPYHVIYHRWFAIRGTWAAWCHFINFLLKNKSLDIGQIGEVADYLDIPHMSTTRTLVIDGKERNYETEEE